MMIIIIIIILRHTLHCIQTDYCRGLILNYIRYAWVLGYEPAGLTVHPPPRMIEGGFNFFRMGV